ncbi:FAD binding domain-containing protein [Rudanella lutea]|uniref:FAD binding domain-containing protein n=1 Tax=Rudanella lutea TaxID=451374 RepID=UPI00035E4BA2|nr:FAD binding domain-containing protein [Rudanella lutea]
MIRFLLNDRLIQTDAPTSTVMLDFIRSNQHLTGTKTGCREGDCGACTVLVGEWADGLMHYRSMTSCLMPLGNAQGRHIVTIEGLNRPDTLNGVQQAMVDEGGTQCGFCTVGFVVSLAGYCLSHKAPSTQNGIASIDGNICRCTGYKSIERAVDRIGAALRERPAPTDALPWLVQQGFLPDYFRQIPQRMAQLETSVQNGLHPTGIHTEASTDVVLVGGGTDLYVQRPETMRHTAVRHVFRAGEQPPIWREDDIVSMSGACTAAQLGESPVLLDHFPDLPAHLKLVSSTPIRNMGTLAGNLINASPIGDLTIWFLALDAQLIFFRDNVRRIVPLRDLYRGYKTLNKHPHDVLESLFFTLPRPGAQFRFEKVCKRTYLDIACVNSAALIETDGDCIRRAELSVGGVAPVPLYLARTSAFLAGKPLSPHTLEEANAIAQTEISPIGDVRGSVAYKRLLVRQLMQAHFASFLEAPHNPS